MPYSARCMGGVPHNGSSGDVCVTSVQVQGCPCLQCATPHMEARGYFQELLLSFYLSLSQGLSFLFCVHTAFQLLFLSLIPSFPQEHWDYRHVLLHLGSGAQSQAFGVVWQSFLSAEPSPKA